ncbi:MAG: class IIb bacteriocin, lactobin A/cerein 7B family [Bacilli bacterium]|nr:class IIb bacteriocin, lactobin A/cerein 7B family [Bacilli bacterium]
MKKIDEKEMMSVSGGAWFWTIGKIAAIIFGTTFVSGLIDGFVRPLRCN